MRAKRLEREQAIELRKMGLSYSEIQARIPVSQASLSLWLRGVKLNPAHRRRLTERKLNGQRFAAQKVHALRLARVANTLSEAKSEAEQLLNAKDVLWLIGTVLYWAEGSKPKPWNHSEQFSFTNMDSSTILIMKGWLERYCAASPEDICYSLYIHHGSDIRSAQEFWLEKLEIAPEALKTYFKKHNPSPKRKNVTKEYHGIIRMRVRRSNSLNYRIAGWIQALRAHCGVVQG